MNKKLYALPLLAVLALSGCGTKNNSTPKETSNGAVPEGGTVVEKSAETEKLAALAQKASKTLASTESVGATISSTGISAELASTKLNGKVNLGSFELKAGGVNLSTGNKENTKAGVEFSGITASVKVDGALEEGSENQIAIDKSFTLCKTAAYLDNGNIYVDASNTDVGTFVSSVANVVKPYASLILASLGQEQAAMMVQPMLDIFSSGKEAVDTFFKTTLGISDYKFKFENVVKDDNYPLFSKIESELDAEEAKKVVTDLKTTLESKTGLKWDDIVKFYTYEDESSALQFDINKEALGSLVTPEQLEGYQIQFSDDTSFKAAVLFNQDGFPVSLSVKENVGLTVGGEALEAQFGSKLTIKESGDIVFAINNTNPVTFPENYDGYNTLSFPSFPSIIPGQTRERE